MQNGFSEMKITSPYYHLNHTGLRGALHAHSTNSDGVNSPHEVWRAYAEKGFQFAALTDHCEQPTLEDLKTETGLITLSGCEYRPGGYTDWQCPEANVIGAPAPLPYGLTWDECCPALKETGAFVIYNHPNWDFDHWPCKKMLSLNVGHAVEIYNGSGDGLAGSQDATNKWDMLLSCGYRIWGVAADDAHGPDQRAKAWVEVYAAPEPAAIFDALKAGCFYASTGVTIESITVKDGEISVKSPSANVIRFIAERGRVVHQVEASEATYRPQASDVYVRIELFGERLQQAWANPVFIESEESRERVKTHTEWFMEQPIT